MIPKKTKLNSTLCFSISKNNNLKRAVIKSLSFLVYNKTKGVESQKYTNNHRSTQQNCGQFVAALLQLVFKIFIQPITLPKSLLFNSDIIVQSFN